jgi:small-conductance mechanosensitive channel
MARGGVFVIPVSAIIAFSRAATASTMSASRVFSLKLRFVMGSLHRGHFAALLLAIAVQIHSLDKIHQCYTHTHLYISLYYNVVLHGH